MGNLAKTILLLLLSNTGSAQVQVRLTDILAGAGTNQTVLAQEEHLRYMKTVAPRLPWVEDIDFRTETDRFELRREEYLARLNVNGLPEMKRQRQLQNSEQQIEEQRLRVYMHEALARRYQALIEYDLLLRRQAIQQQLQMVYTDQLDVFKKMAALSNDTDLDAIIKAEYERDAIALQLEENAASQLDQHRYLQSCTAIALGDWELDTANFIRPVKIAEVVAGLPLSVLQNPEIAEQQAKLGRLDAEYQLERAESAKVLDFVQFRYHNRPDESFNRDFSVGVGFRLPFKGSANLKMDRLKIEQHANQQDLQLFQIELDEQLTIARSQVASLCRRWQLAQEQWQNNQAQFTLDQTSHAAVQGPLTLLQARTLQLKREMNMLNLEQELFEQYLKVLDWSGLLSDLPLVNYLSAGLEVY